MALNLIISPYHPPRFRWTLKGHCRPKVRDYYIFSCQFPQVQFTPAQSCASSKQETDRYSTTSIPRGQTHPAPPEVIHTMKGRMGCGEGGQKAKLQRSTYPLDLVPIAIITALILETWRDFVPIQKSSQHLKKKIHHSLFVSRLIQPRYEPA